MKKKIAFQGRCGAYSESAAYHLFGTDIEVIPVDTFEEIYERIANGSVDGGVVPIENSTAGSIYENYDLLFKWRLPIVAEVKLQISHALCVLPGTQIENLKKIISHPQGLAQCSLFFEKHPHIEASAFYDTAGSAEAVALAKDSTLGAIASSYAANVYGLDVLAEGIENLPGINFTRFYALQKEARPFEKTENLKTTLLFTLANSGKSGALYNALGCFAKRNLNLTRIESRPHPDKPWEYIFHMSFEGNPEETLASEALKELGEYADFIYLLGTFKGGEIKKLEYEKIGV